jgi:hypothetical protein
VASTGFLGCPPFRSLSKSSQTLRNKSTSTLAPRLQIHLDLQILSPDTISGQLGDNGVSLCSSLLYSGGRDQEDHGSKLAQANNSVRPYLLKTLHKNRLKAKALSSSPSTPKKKLEKSYRCPNWLMNFQPRVYFYT